MAAPVGALAHHPRSKLTQQHPQGDDHLEQLLQDGPDRVSRIR